MKLSLRVLVAAVAMIAAGGAFAQTATSSANGSDLYFYAVDGTTGTSVLEDLGTNFASFNPTSAAGTSGFTTNVGSTAAWASFVAADANYLTDASWGVFAGSNNGTLNGLEVTNTSATGASATIKSSSVLSATSSNIANLMNGLSGALISTSTVQSGLFSSVAATSNVLSEWGTTGPAAYLPTGFNTVNTIGSSSTFNYFSGLSSASKSFVSPTVFGGSTPYTFTFSDAGVLTYATVAAVPEPSSYAMMLAGLLMIGAMVVRRRNSK